MSTSTLQKQHLVTNDSPYDLSVKGSEGSYIYGENGHRYIDLMMGWCVGNLGWGQEQLKKVIREFDGPDYVYPGFKYEGWDELAELLTSIAPGKLEKVFRTTGGTESNETALQIAMAYTSRKKFCSLENSYHGNSIATISIGATEEIEKLVTHLPGCLKIEMPLTEKTLSKVETKLKNQDVAAFIMEPIICNYGVHIPEKEFMLGLRELCTKYGTLLILDEVATGFGRTGKLFATEHFDIEPDILCLSKGISSGHAGLGATLTTEKIAKKIKDQVSIYSTYGWHPLSTQVAIANIKFFLKHKKSILQNINERSQQFRTAFSQMEFKKKGKMEIIGMAMAVDVTDKKYAEKIRDKAFEKGLIITTQEEKLVMFPALTIDEETVQEAIEIFKQII